MKTTIIILLVVAASITTWQLWFTDDDATVTIYEFADVKKGDLESSISATGTLNALETVEVGTQVSGPIATVYVDYNSTVTKGQLLAVLDPEVLDAAVIDAQANLERAQAALDQARAELERNSPLHTKGYLSDSEFLPLTTSVRTAQASMTSARATLDKARKNRNNAEIRSPIDGIVIARNVEAGQTVAASLQSPTLFVIARDLTRMEMIANVDESDIGQIRVGQPVRFSVAAFPDELFTGVTREIRLQPEVIQNVVNYKVVVDASNKGQKLLPGMTAIADFVVQTVRDALLVPTAALGVQPTEAMQETLRTRRAAQTGDTSTANRRRRGTGQSVSEDSSAAQNGSGLQRGRTAGNNMKRLWYLDTNGALQVAMVRAGATDGLTTEIHPVRGQIETGMKIIVSAKSEATQPRATAASAFTPPARGGGGRRP